MNEVIYAVVLWLTAQGNVTGVFEEVHAGPLACQTVIDLAAVKSLETGRNIVAKCTTNPLEVGRFIKEFGLNEAS